MATLRTLFLVGLAVWFHATLEAQEVAKVPVKPAALEPADIGIYKYVFEAAPPAGMVMVLRCTASRGDYVYDINDTIEYSGGEKVREVIIVYDPAKFPFADHDDSKPTSVRYSGGHGPGGELTGMQVESTSVGGNSLSFDFTGKGREPVRFRYECFTETYAAAKARVPDLRDMPAGKEGVTAWFHNADVRNKTKKR